jgi:hypothetical protein
MLYGFQVKDLSNVSPDNIIDYATSYAKSNAGYLNCSLNETSEVNLVDGKINKKNSPKHAQKLVPDTIYNPGRF